jgi:glycosyltransferase involved in cell wall biosynthesis
MILGEDKTRALTPSVCLVTIHGFPKIGGGEERFLETFTSYLQKRGVRYVVVSSAVDSDNANVVGSGLRQFKLPLVGFTPYLFLFSIVACLRIVFLNKRYRFSLIHSIDTGYAGLAGLFASKILGLAFVVHAHCCRARLVTLTVASRGGIWRHVITPYQKFESLIDRLVMTHANTVVGVSGEIGSYALSLGVSSEKLVVSPVGLNLSSLKCSDSDKQSVLREFGISPEAFVIGYLGTLARAKGTYTLVEAFTLLQKEVNDDLFLLLVGGGDREYLQNEIGRENRSSVLFAGFRRDIARFLAAMDVFVLPSVSEGCPYSLLEAMAAGKAIVASDIPGIREIVRDEGEAVLINPHDARMLKNAILRLYSDSALRSRLGADAERKATQYDHDRVFSKILGLYGNLERDSNLQSRN